jgi:hypothetical protein
VARALRDWFARLGYDTWCVDCEGNGRSAKSRQVNMDGSSMTTSPTPSEPRFPILKLLGHGA